MPLSCYPRNSTHERISATHFTIVLQLVLSQESENPSSWVIKISNRRAFVETQTLRGLDIQFIGISNVRIQLLMSAIFIKSFSESSAAAAA
jgi:hypothetical protein